MGMLEKLITDAKRYNKEPDDGIVASQLYGQIELSCTRTTPYPCPLRTPLRPVRCQSRAEAVPDPPPSPYVSIRRWFPWSQESAIDSFSLASA